MEKTEEMLLDDFRAGKKEVNRIFLVGLFFILATHFYVLEPYFHYTHQETAFETDKTTLIESKSELETNWIKLATTKNRVNDELKRIRSQVGTFPDQLRDMLPNIKDALDMRSANQLPDENRDTSNMFRQEPMQQQMHNTSSAMIIPGHITEFSEAVVWYIDKVFKELISDLNKSISIPVTELAGHEQIEGVENVGEQCQNAMKKVQNHLSLIDPDFWHTYGGPGGKLDVAEEISKTIDQAFSPLEKNVGQVLKQTETLLKSKAEKVEDIKEKLAEMEINIAALAERLKTLESPFGPIPLGLTEIIRIFPFIITAFAVFMTARLSRTLNLRKIMQDNFNKEQNSLSASIKEYQLGGWLFSISNPGLSFILFSGWYIVVIILACRSAWLIGWTNMIFKSEISFIFINQAMYKACFIAALVLILLAAFISLKKVFHGIGINPNTSA